MKCVHGSGARGAALGALALRAACTSGSRQIELAGPMPWPQMVVVQDFAVAASAVQLDPGLSGMIDETLRGTSGTPRTAQELPPGIQTGLVISGQFVSIDQGSRAERVAIGLGAGRSDVRVRAQLFDVGPQARVAARAWPSSSWR